MLGHNSSRHPNYQPKEYHVSSVSRVVSSALALADHNYHKSLSPKHTADEANSSYALISTIDVDDEDFKLTIKLNQKNPLHSLHVAVFLYYFRKEFKTFKLRYNHLPPTELNNLITYHWNNIISQEERRKYQEDWARSKMTVLKVKESENDHITETTENEKTCTKVKVNSTSTLKNQPPLFRNPIPISIPINSKGDTNSDTDIPLRTYCLEEVELEDFEENISASDEEKGYKKKKIMEGNFQNYPFEGQYYNHNQNFFQQQPVLVGNYQNQNPVGPYPIQNSSSPSLSNYSSFQLQSQIQYGYGYQSQPQPRFRGNGGGIDNIRQSNSNPNYNWPPRHPRNLQIIRPSNVRGLSPQSPQQPSRVKEERPAKSIFDDDEFAEKMTAFKRYKRNNNLINEIVSETIVPNETGIISESRLCSLQNQAKALQSHKEKLDNEIKVTEERFEAKKRRILEENETFMDQYQQAYSPVTVEKYLQLYKGYYLKWREELIKMRANKRKLAQKSQIQVQANQSDQNKASDSESHQDQSQSTIDTKPSESEIENENDPDTAEETSQSQSVQDQDQNNVEFQDFNKDQLIIQNQDQAFSNVKMEEFINSSI